jgi:acetyltransferase-like isoleucine patch superfamily enzyme
VIGDNVTIGSGVTILTERICSGAVIGAGSVVVKPIKVKGVYAGNPARRCLGSYRTARHSNSLPHKF